MRNNNMNYGPSNPNYSTNRLKYSKFGDNPNNNKNINNLSNINNNGSMG